MKTKVLAPRGAGRRRIVIAGVLTALSFRSSYRMLAGGALPVVFSADINDYALYAVQTLQLKGGGTAAQSQIDGNIAAGTSTGSTATRFRPRAARTSIPCR